MAIILEKKLEPSYVMGPRQLPKILRGRATDD